MARDKSESSRFIHSPSATQKTSEDGVKMSNGDSRGSVRLAWGDDTLQAENWHFLLLVSLASAVALALIVIVWLMAQMSSAQQKDNSGSSGGGVGPGGEEKEIGEQIPAGRTDESSTLWFCQSSVVSEQCETDTISPSLTPPPPPPPVSCGEIRPLGRTKVKGLLERRGSSASLTIDVIHQEVIPSVTPTKECASEEFLLSVSNTLTRQQLRSCLRDVRAIHREFWELPLNHPEKILVPGSWAKNRYRTVIPNETTRVRLPDCNINDSLSGYINANYIKGYDGEEKAFIATQGPMTNTVNDLWGMAWNERSPVIVMITKLCEKGRPKCEAYLPEELNIPVLYGEVYVTVLSIKNKDGFAIRQISLEKNNDSKRLVHFWFDSWPDHKTPANAHSLLSLAKEVEIARQHGAPQRRPSAVWLSSSPSVKESVSPVLNLGSLELKSSDSPRSHCSYTSKQCEFDEAVNVELVKSVRSTSFEMSPSKKRTKQSDDYEREPSEGKCFFRTPNPEVGIIFKFGTPLERSPAASEDSVVIRPSDADSSTTHLPCSTSASLAAGERTAFDFDRSFDDSACCKSSTDTVFWKFEKLSTNSTGSYDTAQSPGWSIDKSCRLSVDSPNWTADTSPLTGSDRSPFRTNSSFDSPAFSSSGSKRCPTQSSGDSSIWTASEDSPVEECSPKVLGPVSPCLLSPRWLEGSKGPPAGPVIVHCSAGIGRTGCFIAICIGVSQLLNENTVDILGIVSRMRSDRGGMVQTAEQYEFIHRALALFEKSLPDQSGE